MFLYEYELGKASSILVRELFKLKPGETFVITADTQVDPRVVDATASTAFAVDAKPMVIWIASHRGRGTSVDSMLPVGALTAVLKEADAWVEFGQLLYSTPYNIAIKENKKLRHLCLVGMNADMMVRCIGRVDYPVLKEFMEKVVEMTKNAKHVRMTTPAGEDVEFDNAKIEIEGEGPDQKYHISLGYADVPGSHMAPGQIAWPIDLESVKGTIVFDGTVSSGCKDPMIKEPIHLTIKAGEIIKVEGGKQAKEFEAWMKSYNHPLMLKLAHVCYGFNPGAKLTGIPVEDERVWGSTEWGIGHMLWRPAPSHCDGICLNTSVWLDDKKIMDEGRMVEPDLVKLAQKLGET